MRNRRRFSPEFKSKIVLEILSGTRSAAEMCREYRLKPDLLSRWKSSFIEQASLVFERDAERDVEQARIAELECLVGRLTLENEILKKGSIILARLRSRGER